MTRRFVAVALFVLATSWLGAAMLRRLGAVRAQDHAQVAMEATPARRTGDAVAALRGMRADGVMLSVDAAGGGQARVGMTGPEPAVIRGIAAIEAVRPAVRFVAWRMTSEAGTADRVRFDAVAVAAAR